MTERILCLDNDVGTLEVIVEFLRTESYDCDTATTAASALVMLEDSRYALFMIELYLPGASGLDIMAQALEMDPDLACIIVTGMMDVNDAVEAMRAGASDFLIKPFHIGDLAFTVDKTLERRRLLIENHLYQTHLEERIRAATTELEQANDELRHTKEYLENLLDSSVDTVLTISKDFEITYANRGVTAMLGYAPESLVGSPMARLLRGFEEEARRLRTHIQAGPLRNHETEMVHQEGFRIPVTMSLSQIHGTGGAEASVLAICRDITQQKELENQLKEMTIRDSLTGLYNQRYFHERLESEIERARRQNHPLSLLLFDVDHFKDYNDTHGHLEGDGVLKAIGEVVRECTRDYVDIGFRYGGDEFTVILPETDSIPARRVAERIRETFEARRFGDCTLSVGLMTYRKGSTPQSFIRFADEMMYDAKRSGGNRVYVFNPDDNRIMLEEREVERDAVGRDRDRMKESS